MTNCTAEYTTALGRYCERSNFQPPDPRADGILYATRNEIETAAHYQWRTFDKPAYEPSGVFWGYTGGTIASVILSNLLCVPPILVSYMAYPNHEYKTNKEIQEMEPNDRETYEQISSKANMWFWGTYIVFIIVSIVLLVMSIMTFKSGEKDHDAQYDDSNRPEPPLFEPRR